MSSIVTSLSSAAIMANPSLLIPAQREGKQIFLYDLDRTVEPDFEKIKQLIAEIEDDEAADMVSLRTDRTGVDNTVFASTKGHGRHAARIKIAVDPPDSFNATSKGATMSLHDYKTIGEPLQQRVFNQAKQFIEHNRAALLAYWNCEIDTDTFIQRLKPPR